MGIVRNASEECTNDHIYIRKHSIKCRINYVETWIEHEMTKFYKIYLQS